MTNHQTTMPLYRNLASTEISTNNNKNVLLIVLLYCYSSTWSDGAMTVKGKKVKGLVSQVTDEVATMAEQVSDKIFSLISSMSKRQNVDTSEPPVAVKKEKKKFEKFECLAADCTDMTSYSLCPLHYHSLISAKISSLKLRIMVTRHLTPRLASLSTHPRRHLLGFLELHPGRRPRL